MGGTGFPSLMFLDAEGRRIAWHSGPRTVKGFEESYEEVEDFLDLVQRAESGDERAATDVLIRQLELEWFDYEEARARSEALTKVSSKQKKELAQLLIDTEVRTLAKEAKDDPAKRTAAGERFLAMWKDKQVPADEPQLYAFWSVLADYAEAEKDKRLFQKVVLAFEDSLGSNARYRRALEGLEQRLESFPRR